MPNQMLNITPLRPRGTLPQKASFLDTRFIAISSDVGFQFEASMREFEPLAERTGHFLQRVVSGVLGSVRQPVSDGDVMDSRLGGDRIDAQWRTSNFEFQSLEYR